LESCAIGNFNVIFCATEFPDGDNILYFELLMSKNVPDPLNFVQFCTTKSTLMSVSYYSVFRLLFIITTWYTSVIFITITKTHKKYTKS